MSEVAIRVAVRVRPFSRRELEQNQKSIIRVLDNTTVLFDPDEDDEEFFFHGAKQTHRDITKRVKKKMNMEFDSVFDDTADNDKVYDVLTKPLIGTVMEGFNCSVFVYGATGAGKTHTMLGGADNPGITFLTMRELFHQIEQLSEDRKFDIGISYLEVYNEQVMNLLTKSGPLILREDSNGVVVSGLVLKQIRNADELFDLLVIGNKNRTQHPTDSNAESSRSHAIFQVHIRMTDKKTSVRRMVKLSMIDLAGSERAQSTKCVGLRFKEGANINKSLLALGNCITSLADGRKHIPYRDSNLTRILKDSLGGNCRTLMIANISPSSLTYEDTYNTLKYASRAKNIKTTLQKNILGTNMPKEFLLKKFNMQTSELDKLKSENEKLKERVKMLESELADQQILLTKKAATPVVNVTGPGGDSDNGEWYQKIEEFYCNFRKIYEKCLSLQSVEKVLNYRISCKEKTEEVRRILSLDGSRLESDLMKIEASIDKYHKESSKIHTEDSARWIKRFKDGMKSIDGLRREVREKNAQPLNVFLQMKDMELENLKLNVKISHVNKVNGICQHENDGWAKIAIQASTIIQENYLLLRSSGDLDNGMKEKLTALLKMIQGERNVKFLDESSPAVDIFELNLCDWRDEMGKSPMSARKRANDLCDSEELDAKKKKASSTNQFLRPKAVKSINFIAPFQTQTGNNAPQDLNVTFDAGSPKPSTSAKVLADKGNRITSANTVKTAKSSKPSSKYTLNINKENKKFSPTSRIKKSQRTPVRVPGSRDHRPKLVKAAVSSALVAPTSREKLRMAKK